MEAHCELIRLLGLTLQPTGINDPPETLVASFSRLLVRAVSRARQVSRSTKTGRRLNPAVAREPRVNMDCAASEWGKRAILGHQNCCYDVQSLSPLQRWLLLRWIHTRISSPQFLSSMMGTQKVWQPPSRTFLEEDSLVEEELTQSAALVFGVGARAALHELDEVELEAEFITRACVMKFPPVFLRGQYRSAMRFALHRGLVNNVTRWDRQGHGSCSCASHDFCCRGLPEED